MKAFIIICTCLFFVSLIGFSITAALTGIEIGEALRSGNFNIGWSGWSNSVNNWNPYNVKYTFEDAYDNIEIGVLAARANIRISPDGITRVNYTGNQNHHNVVFIAEIDGNTLVVKESGWFSSGQSWNWNWNWGWNSVSGTGRATLDVELPEEFFNEISINITSGRLDAELPETDNLRVSVTSGSVTLDYNHNNRANHLYSRVTSGTININGFSPDTYDVHTTSGTIRINGLSGSGSVRLVSGSAHIDFAEWDGDLGVNVTSGNANITVPGGSGADIQFSRASGSMSYNMDGDSGRLNRSGSMSVGGANRQKVNVNVTSGSANITTK
jgi:lia operon protein LiaG